MNDLEDICGKELKEVEQRTEEHRKQETGQFLHGGAHQVPVNL